MLYAWLCSVLDGQAQSLITLPSCCVCKATSSDEQQCLQRLVKLLWQAAVAAFSLTLGFGFRRV